VRDAIEQNYLVVIHFNISSQILFLSGTINSETKRFKNQFQVISRALLTEQIIKKFRMKFLVFLFALIAAAIAYPQYYQGGGFG
jgi:hypothetical protein